jgi:hypothetical protein
MLSFTSGAFPVVMVKMISLAASLFPGMIAVGKYTASTTLFFRLFSFLLAVTIFRWVA